jgi:hypothetical protein
MSNATTERKHWTEAQMWQNKVTGETISAGELIKRNDRYFRVNRMPGLCSATFDVRAEDNSTWKRIS